MVVRSANKLPSSPHILIWANPNSKSDTLGCGTAAFRVKTQIFAERPPAGPRAPDGGAAACPGDAVAHHRLGEGRLRLVLGHQQAGHHVPVADAVVELVPGPPPGGKVVGIVAVGIAGPSRG